METNGDSSLRGAPQDERAERIPPTALFARLRRDGSRSAFLGMSFPASAVAPVALSRLIAGQPAQQAEDVLAVEEPLEIRIDDRSLAVVMRTPGHDRELAAGFLWTEGIIRSREEVLDLVHCSREGEVEPNVLNVLLARGCAVDWERLQRHTFASSSCGLCGKVTIDAARATFPSVVPSPPVARDRVRDLPGRLRAAQVGFDQTGGLHASGLFDAQGQLIQVREDVGRHNALDKIVGWAFLSERLPLTGAILVVSGRVSFELMQKSLAAGIGCVVAISAPTHLAVDFARANGQTLVGFVRGDRMNVYAGTIA